MRVFWKYYNDMNTIVSIYERDTDTKRERLVYDTDIKPDFQDTGWARWQNDTIEKERMKFGEAIKEISKDEAFLEMI